VLKTRQSCFDSLAGALALRSRELLAAVGSGGKSAALQLLAAELGSGARDGRALVTTTTKMMLDQLKAAAPVVLQCDFPGLLSELRQEALRRPVVAAARSVDGSGKAVGLPPDWIDELWSTGAFDVFLVEADGSKGRSLKAFAPHEPQVPRAATTVVQVMGIDVLGTPLTEANVHRAGLLSAALGVPLGASITSDLLVGALRYQLAALRACCPHSRVVTLLNKAEDGDSREAGLRIARTLMAGSPAPGVARGPEAVVVGSVARQSFVRVDQPAVSAIVLAAGSGSRMGEQKLLLQIAGRTIIEWVVDAALGSGADEVIVVVGAEGEKVRESLERRAVKVVENAHYMEGMSTSIRAGLDTAAVDTDAVAFLLGDQPFVTSQLIDLVLARFAETGAPLVRPIAAGRPAHPVLIGRDLFPELRRLEGDLGARELIVAHAEQAEFVQLDDGRAAFDIDTPSDYRSALPAT
jgi:molybdenum cofactor cytidylyltransferase